MPPPSPVWAWDYQSKKGEKSFEHATLQMSVTIENRLYESKEVTLKVKGVKEKEKK